MTIPGRVMTVPLVRYAHRAQNLSGGHGCDGKDQKREGATCRPRCQTVLLGDPGARFFRKRRGPEQKGCDSQSGGAQATTGLSTCAPPLNAPPYGRRRGSAQAERPVTLFIVRVGAKLNDQMGPNEVVKLKRL